MIGFNVIFDQLSSLSLAIYAPVTYILPSRLKKYEVLYDTVVADGKRHFKQADREKSLQALMTTNLLKRLESSVESFRLTLQRLQANHEKTLAKIDNFMRSGMDLSLLMLLAQLKMLKMTMKIFQHLTMKRLVKSSNQIDRYGFALMAT